MTKKFENIDILCKNLDFAYEDQVIKINNYNELCEYMRKINDKAKNIEIINKEIDDINNINKFISIYDKKIKCYYESISGTIKFTKEIKIKQNSKKEFKYEYINNVFILNKDKEKFCYEIKLGNGKWDNFINNKNNINYKKKDINRPILKIGLLKIKENKIKELNENFYYNNGKIEIESNSNKDKYFILQSEDELKIKAYEIYKKNIYYSIDVNNILKKPYNQINKDKITNISTIHKNDVIGIVFDKILNKEFIKIDIYINGSLVNSEVVPNIIKDKNKLYFNINDDYNIENIERNGKDLLIPFIELGPNNSIFIKDKPNNNIVISNEKIEFYNIYKCASLNDFPANIDEIQNISEYYMEVMIKIGNKLIYEYPDILNEDNFKNFINIFEYIIIKNNTIIKNKILYFLSNDLNLNDMTKFKENIRSLFLVIYNSKSIDYKLKLIIELLIELILEKSFNLINIFELNNNNNSNIILELIRYKFSLCIILFDNFYNQKKIINPIFNNLSELLFNDNDLFTKFCFSIFNNILYVDTSNAYILLKEKSFYDNNNSFNKNKLLLLNLKKPNNNNNLTLDYIFQFYEFIIEEFFIKHFILQNEQLKKFINFILIYVKFQDNFSVLFFFEFKNVN